MPEIPLITSPNIQIREIEIPEVITTTEYYTSTPLAPPVVVNIGVPIVDVPGCVEAHESNNKSKKVGIDDPKGVVTYCDAGVPSYDPINYEPEKILPTTSAGIPKTDSPEKPETPEVEPSVTKTPPVNTAKVDCPTPAQEAKEPVGTLVEGFRKKVVEYKLMGNECVQITEAVPLPQQIVDGLPSGGQVVQVGGVAVIATTSALLAKPLADILLKAVKPTVKKVMKKIAAIRKKPIPVLSAGERRAEQRQMNHAVKALRSVFPRQKKKR
jgi:hypothetical protein